MRKELFALCVMSLCFSTGVKAEEIVFTLTGSVVSRTANLDPYLYAGQPVALTYRFESTTPDLDPDPALGDYAGAISTLVLRIGDYTWTTESVSIQVRNDHRPDIWPPSGIDAYSLSKFGGITGPILVGESVRHITFAMDNYPALSTNVLDDDSLPSRPPQFDLTLLNSHSGQIGFVGVTAFAGFRFQSVSLQLNGTDVIPRKVNPFAGGVIPIVLLGSEHLGVEDFDVSTLRFGPSDATCKHDLTDEWTFNEHVEDVNLDGHMDLKLHFQTGATGIACGDTEATLSGRLLDGTLFEGSDAFETVGCNSNGPPRPGAANQRTGPP